MTDSRCSFYGVAARFVLRHRYTAKNNERRLTNNERQNPKRYYYLTDFREKRLWRERFEHFNLGFRYCLVSSPELDSGLRLEFTQKGGD